jgi:hypothetical protein
VGEDGAIFTLWYARVAAALKIEAVEPEPGTVLAARSVAAMQALGKAGADHETERPHRLEVSFVTNRLDRPPSEPGGGEGPEECLGQGVDQLVSSAWNWARLRVVADPRQLHAGPIDRFDQTVSGFGLAFSAIDRDSDHLIEAPWRPGRAALAKAKPNDRLQSKAKFPVYG